MTDLLLTGLRQLVTNDPDREGLLGLVDDGSIAIRGGRIAWVGPAADLPAEHRDLPESDWPGRVAVPGFIDCHTHLVFAGHRASEFAQRLAGRSYEEIMTAGGGIQSTVRATQAATTEDLLDETLMRVRRMLEAGTTTVEVKSGYALDAAGERRMLEVAQAIMEREPIDVVPTYLAHTVPAESQADRDAYVERIATEIIPACAQLARFIDVFCDDGVFSLDESRRIVAAGKRHGLVPRLHANQLAASGGAGLGAELGAASVDHLDHATDGEIAALAAAGTVAVLLPGVSLSMRLPFPDSHRFVDAGVPVAIATDANPGTSYVLTMPFVIALAVLEMGMSPEQALWSATRGGALALQESDKGWLRAGAAADLVILDADSYLHLAYRPDTKLVGAVVKGGYLVA